MRFEVQLIYSSPLAWSIELCYGSISPSTLLNLSLSATGDAWVPQTTSAHVLNIILQLHDANRCAPKFDSKLKSGQGKCNPR